MAKVLLVLATVADLALAALLIGVSGFIFGGGPEAGQSGALLKLAYIGEIVLCVGGPIAGFMLNANKRPGLGLLIAWLPLMLGGIASVMPPP